ncbi:hypothetical protein K501DRAFT_287780 [Backusella circina FSU 941]|nr:hypothetical protein K501DRAFT_287780 [Backusella circina FSU 941]
MEWHYQGAKESYWSFDVASILNNGLTLNHPELWPYLRKLALLGKTDQLNKMMKHVLHQTKADYPHLVSIFQLVDRYCVDGSEPDLELVKRLQMDKEAKNHAENALQLISILKGDVDTIFKYADNDVIEAIVASLYYNMESIDSIQEYAQDITKNRKSQSSVYYYLLVGDIYRALEHCSMDWWLLVHMSDILKTYNMLSEPILLEDRDDNRIERVEPTYYFASYYGSCLFHRYGLFKEGIYYLSQCKGLGKERIIYLLETWETVDESSVDDIMEICIKSSLREHGLKLYGKVGDQHMLSRDYKKAIIYYYQAELYKQIESVFMAILKEYAVSGQLFPLNDLNALYRGVYPGPCSEIYYKLVEYTKLKEDDFKVLTKHYLSLVSTISEPSTPNWIKPILYFKGMKLLQDDPIHFDHFQLLYLKKLWKDLKGTMEMNDYKWLVYYLGQGNNGVTDMLEVDRKDEDPVLLNNAMSLFFDTTAIAISQAFKRVKN